MLYGIRKGICGTHHLVWLRQVQGGKVNLQFDNTPCFGISGKRRDRVLGVPDQPDSKAGVCALCSMKKK
jgi:hypothetical protein